MIKGIGYDTRSTESGKIWLKDIYFLKTWTKRQVTWSFSCQELGANIELLIHQDCTLSNQGCTLYTVQCPPRVVQSFNWYQSCGFFQNYLSSDNSQRLLLNILPKQVIIQLIHTSLAGQDCHKFKKDCRSFYQQMPNIHPWQCVSTPVKQDSITSMLLQRWWVRRGIETSFIITCSFVVCKFGNKLFPSETCCWQARQSVAESIIEVL